ERMGSSSKFQGQTILITGASSGLGEEFARQLVAMGARVGLVARRAELMEKLAGELNCQGDRVVAAVADVSDRESLKSAVAELARRLRINVFDRVLLNAGVGITFKAKEFSAARLEEVTRVNYLGAANTIEAVLPGMIAARAGHIVGVSSLSARRGLPVGFAYGASKAAMTTMLEGMRVELKPLGIAVTVIHPGFIRTPMTSNQETPQPGLLDPEVAVRGMLQAIASRKKQYNFPFSTTFLTGALRRMPVALSDFLVEKVVLKSIEDAERKGKER
ncbi:MAG: SDR family NAD(P)-dependent oxidoreductase, partial [bacterium]